MQTVFVSFSPFLRPSEPAVPFLVVERGINHGEPPGQQHLAVALRAVRIQYAPFQRAFEPVSLFYLQMSGSEIPLGRMGSIPLFYRIAASLPNGGGSRHLFKRYHPQRFAYKCRVAVQQPYLCVRFDRFHKSDGNLSIQRDRHPQNRRNRYQPCFQFTHRVFFRLFFGFILENFLCET